MIEQPVNRRTFVPIYHWDRMTGRVFWQEKEIPRLIDRSKSDKENARLAWLKKDKHHSK